MADKKVTTMVVKVDLNCEKCRKKIKKVLCDIPQVQNQVYDEKANTVTITVVCCNPEMIKKKICCKGGKTVKGFIEIKVPEKPKEPEKPKKPAPPRPPDKPKEPEKPKPEKPTEPEKPKKPAPKPKEPEKPPAVKPPPKPAPPIVLPWPCCRECYEGRGGGPCYYGRGMAAPPCYGGYGRPVYDSWGGGGYRGPCYVSRYDYCVSEENPGGCIIM